MTRKLNASITHPRHRLHVQRWLFTIFAALFVVYASADPGAQRDRFQQAWNAASRGDHATFDQLGLGLQDYILYPYHRYEHYRANRARTPADEMAGFLGEHDDWAFTSALRTAWLKSLGARGRWRELLDHAEAERDIDVRCYVARARIELGESDGLLEEVRDLWVVGKSQPDSCNPVFDWLRKNDGITPALAWERIRLAMQAGNPRFTLYLARYIPAKERVWLERWQELNRSRYRHLARARSWPDQALTRMITAISLKRLARYEPEQAMRAFKKLDGHFAWGDDERGSILREIAFRSALGLTDDADNNMRLVPAAHRDGQLLEWWARLALNRQDWDTVAEVIGQMQESARADGRWRYWWSVAKEHNGDAAAAREMQEALSQETTFYGFMAADRLGRPYTICPLQPEVGAADIEQVRARPGFARALELRYAGIGNWALAEWVLEAGRLGVQDLRAAAGLAHTEGWHDRAIFALGNSGDRRYYDWRFPLVWEQAVGAEAARQQLDASWILGVMRSESALDENARSSAGALGLMQVTPATARRLARRHGLDYQGSAQLREGGENIRFGTTFMRELMDRFGENPVLVAGAYNAGPKAVERWLDERPSRDAAIWMENIPYFETRDYIPRVLAFTAIYDWRMQKPIKRVASRMPGLDSGNIGSVETTEAVCLVSKRGN